jgi:hypothetical protein
VDVIRDITEADVGLLASTDRGMTPTPLKRLGDRHHALARILAAGTPESEAAAIVGYDISRVSILKNSPAFIELLDFYRAEVKTQFQTTVEHMAGLSKDALLELRDRLEEEPDKFSNRELLNIITDLADRAGAGEGEGLGPTRIELVPFVEADGEGSPSSRKSLSSPSMSDS